MAPFMLAQRSVIVAHDIRHGLKANQQIRADGLRRKNTVFCQRSTDEEGTMGQAFSCTHVSELLPNGVSLTLECSDVDGLRRL
jgi:hypothetical protein